MQTQATGTFVGGVVRLDTPIDLPENSRVSLSIKSLDESEEPNNPQLAWERIKADLAENPINSGGLRYTRDQLHERD